MSLSTFVDIALAILGHTDISDISAVFTDLVILYRHREDIGHKLEELRNTMPTLSSVGEELRYWLLYR